MKNNNIVSYDTKNPTDTTYKTLQAAYEFFNKELFSNKLPVCLITMQRKGKTFGFFCSERFETRNKNKAHIHEIALNPAYFNNRSDRDIISTLVHEMAHLWQQEYGDPPRGNYHDREWGRKMKEIGLIPSNTGEKGGKETGQSMSHYVQAGGKYEHLIGLFLAKSGPLYYQDRPSLKIAAKKKKNKIKYSCQICGLNAWGRPGANLMCGDDQLKMQEINP